MRYFSLTLILTVFWLALSGHYTTLLLIIGAACVGVTVWLTHRMRVLDDEGHPIELSARTLFYYPWLLVEIVKSAWAVTRIILRPGRIEASPTLTEVTATQKSGAGVATYANSITLTPGTVTVLQDDALLTVHALTEAGADDVEAGEMDRRVTAFEGSD